MTSELLQCVELEPQSAARFAVIWLHGLGADGNDFPPIVPELGLDARHAVRFVFPHAPRIPVTLNQGMVMRAWYDIAGLDLRKRHDEKGVRRATAQVEALVEREKGRGVPSERIVLAGFSQGGAVALFSALRWKERLAGCVALSTYLVCEEALATERSAANQHLPIFQAHGLFDEMVAIERGRAAQERLLEWGYQVEWQAYPMGHQVCLEEIEALGRWFDARFAAAEQGSTRDA